MAQRGNNQAKSGANAALGENQQLYNQGQSLYGGLEPSLMTTMAHPQGIDPSTMAKMKTSNMEAAGGTQAGATGQGALLSGRTRNAGSADAAIGDSARAAGQQLGTANQKTDIANAAIQEKQREGAQSGLENLYGTNMATSAKTLGEIPSMVNADTSAASQSYDWFTKLVGPLLKQAGGAAGGGG